MDIRLEHVASQKEEERKEKGRQQVQNSKAICPGSARNGASHSETRTAMTETPLP